MISPAVRMEHLQLHFFASLSSRVSAMQAAGIDVIRLDEGAPDMPPAAPITDTLREAVLLPDRHSYQPHRGPAALREAWAWMYQNAYGVELDPDREIVPLLGSKEGIFHFLCAYIEPGDMVLVPDPGYITYSRGTLFAGGTPFF